MEELVQAVTQVEFKTFSKTSLVMGVLVLAIIFSFIVGAIGGNRKIGFGWAFVISILLSPLIGLIVVLLSSKIEK